MIRLNDITKYYSSGYIKTFVLRDINLEIEEGDFITIMGPSGAGKSTLLHIIGMLDTPSNGEYYFYDQPVHKFNEKKRSEIHKNYIGFVFQSYHLIDELTVYENLETPLLYKKIRERERKNAVDGLINGIEDPEMRLRMRTLQNSWDRKMKHAGSKENRFVLAKAFFWEHFHEVWQPALQEFNALLNGKSDR